MEKVLVKVLFFAKASELSGTKESFTNLPVKIEYQALLSWIVKEFNLEEIQDSIILAVNEEFVNNRLLELKEGDELAVIPPLSGDEELTCDKIVSLTKSPDCGAVSLFIGTTRDNFDGLEVKCLRYDAYNAMALKEMEKICQNIREKWPSVVNIAIYHRLGEVAVTEASVIIAVSSPHRQESLNAVNYAINSLKSSVPIWKKEEYSGSAGVWKVNKECAWGQTSDKL